MIGKNGRSSWERQGITAFCTCQWNERNIHHRIRQFFSSETLHNKCCTKTLLIICPAPLVFFICSSHNTQCHSHHCPSYMSVQILHPHCSKCYVDPTITIWIAQLPQCLGYWLGGPRFDSLHGQEYFLHKVQVDCEDQPASYYVNTGGKASCTWR